MADISYTPTFHHVRWEDRKNRVEAAGPNGFNVRFNAIASDLRQLSAVVTQVGEAIDSTNVPPPPQQQRLTFTPSLRNRIDSTRPWFYDANGVATAQLNPSPGVQAFGVSNLNLPDGYWLTALRVVGSINAISGAPLFGSVTLARTPIRLVVPPATPETLATATGIGGSTQGAFDLPVPTTATLIDTGVFRYLLTLGLTGLNGTMKVEAVQLTLTPPS
ncbi:hypothetical protein [Streptomyces sp. NPDC008092]|uniref:hypothetical protein n=1 Tax=Streptomyces sp. NPDC008092 TaxID=3364808 RepID=UPI0036E4FC23